MNIILVGLPRGLADYVSTRLTRLTTEITYKAYGFYDENGHPIESKDDYVARITTGLLQFIPELPEGTQVCLVSYSQDYVELLQKAVFPSLVIFHFHSVGLEYFSRSNAKARVNSISDVTISKLRSIRTYLADLQSEISKVSSCPFLLPDRHFKSTELTVCLSKLSSVDLERNPHPIPSKVSKELKSRVKFSTTRRNHYQGDDGALFFTPGRALHGHTYPPETQDPSHRLNCHLGARLRLGSEINSGFHFDCEKLSASNRGFIASCHGQAVVTGKSKYLNVYPNNYVRKGS